MRNFLLLVSLIAIAVSCARYGEKLEINKGTLYYTEKINIEDAQKLGDYLLANKFFDGNPKSVQIDKKNDTFLFRIVVKPEKQHEQNTVDLLTLFAFHLSSSVFDGQAVNIHVCNDKLKTVKIIYPYNTLGKKMEVENGIIYYPENIDMIFLNKLKVFLKDNYFFKGEYKVIQVEENNNSILFKIRTNYRQLSDQNFEISITLLTNKLKEENFINKDIEVFFCDYSFSVLKQLL